MKKSIAIIGCGPSALMFASIVDTNKYNVTIYEKNTAPARKFLVAGDGGFNLTHSESIDSFIKRYTPNYFLEKCLRHFTNNDLCDFLKTIGIETYIGTSKRIFPKKGIKPIDVLNAFLKKIELQNITLKTKHTWKGWTENNELIIEHQSNDIILKSDFVIFSLGGASWPITGSDGSWLNLFKQKGIEVESFLPSNCTYKIHWNSDFINQHHGCVLKNIKLTCDDNSKKGEVVITKFGMEGGAIYFLSPQIRQQLLKNNESKVYIDLKPDLTQEGIFQILSDKKGNESITKILKNQLNLTPSAIALLKSVLTKEEFQNIKILTRKIKKLSLLVTGFAPIDEAISSVGGVTLNEVNEKFELKNLSQHYVIGEMLNWDAPTGGYLLQGCFSMGAYLANKLNKKN